MPKPTLSALREWGRLRFYYLVAPIIALLIVALVLPLRPFQQLEYLTVSARFQARAPFDPPADPRLLMVGIDQQTLDNLGRFPWPRTVEADFLKTLAQAPQPPHTVSFDIFFTEKSQTPSDDDALANAAGQLPSVITGAIEVRPFRDNPAMETQSEQETRADLAQLGLTQPLTHIHGDVSRLFGSNLGRFPCRFFARKASSASSMTTPPASMPSVIPFPSSFASANRSSLRSHSKPSVRCCRSIPPVSPSTSAISCA